jgi:hypothetical protein
MLPSPGEVRARPSGFSTFEAERGTKLPVRRIRYLKHCATLDVAPPDGGEGYVVLGVNPHLTHNQLVLSKRLIGSITISTEAFALLTS